MLNFKETIGVEKDRFRKMGHKVEFCPQKSTDIQKTKEGRRISLGKHLHVLVSPRMNCACATVALADVGFSPAMGKELAYITQKL